MIELASREWQGLGKAKRVLVVGDEDTIATALEYLLTREGYAMAYPAVVSRCDTAQGIGL